jgi:hypothetical protein
VVESTGGRDLPGLDTTVREGWGDNEVRLLWLLEKHSTILEEVGLFAFDGEVVMRPAVVDQVGREVALS